MAGRIRINGESIIRRAIFSALLSILLALSAATTASAGCGPEYIIAGSATYKGQLLSANDSQFNISIELNGVELDSYSMGSDARYGDFYVLRIPTEDGAGDPCTLPNGTKNDPYNIFINGEPVDQNPVSIADISDATRQIIIPIGVSQWYYRDADEDGFGDPNDSIQAETQPDGYVEDNTDCDDENRTINTAATEVCDGKDNNCNGAVDEDLVATATQCGTGACAAEGLAQCVEGQIVDNCTPGEPSDEVCDNADNDCDGSVDEDLTRETTCGVGACAGNTGQETCLAGDWTEDTCDPLAGATAEVCNGEDDDCDGAADEELPSEPTTCGVGECAAEGVLACVEGQLVDSCIPGDPSAEEVCDGKDNNCNGSVDEDLVATATQCGTGACAAEGLAQCVEGQIVDNCTPGEPADEVCDNADNDCDGSVDEDLTRETTCGVGACGGNTGQETCLAGDWTEDTCDPLAGATAEVCNGEDDDCDGAADEELPSEPTTCGVGECAAEGVLACVEGQLVDSCTPGDPSAEEVCDGKDNNCNGSVDEDLLATATTCGVGECAAEGSAQCVEGQIVDNCTPGEPADEVCDNADNDCDGSVDEDLTRETTCGVGACGGNTGQETCLAGDWTEDTCDPLAGATAEVCNGEDDDCDGAADEELPSEPTTCGVGECAAEGLLACVEGQLVDSCTPGDPSAEEVCDGKDNNCNGSVDEDLVASVITCGVGACEAEGLVECVEGQIVDNCTPGEPSEEVCDGVDNNCNEQVDEGLAETPTTCGIGECVAEGVLECVEGQLVDSCIPGDPSAEEVCDGKDNNCNGSVDEDLVATATQCGTGACAAEGLAQCVEGQIVDNCTPGEPADEVCDNADNDCDGSVDEDLTRETTCGVGACAGNTGQETCLAGDWTEDTCDPLAGATAEVCNGEDDDCDGAADEELPSEPTTCGVGECAAEGLLACVEGQLVDSCTPGDPSAEEVCDGKDNNCNGSVDEDLVASVITCGVGACEAEGLVECVEGQIVDNCTPGEPSEEVCDGVDNNCNEQVDEGLAETPTTCGIGECVAEGVLECVEGQLVDSCIPGDPSAEEVCDGKDNNCNGSVDEDLVATATQCGTGACAAEGLAQCVEGQIVDNCTPGEPADEVCDNADNDCDGSVDEDLTRETTCGVGACAGNTGQETCLAGDWTEDTCDPLAGATAEVCNGEDDDCDGAADEELPSEPTTCGVGECAAEGLLACVEGQLVDSCTPGDPSAEEVCDGKDNNCNGSVDEDLVASVITCGVGACEAEGLVECVEGQIVDNCTPGEPSEEVCDGVDNNCNEQVDEGLAETPTTCGIGECVAEGVLECVEGQLVDSCTPGDPTVEIAGDCIDQDCNDNDPPLADAGDDQANVSLGPIYLSGSGTDCDEDELTLSWIILMEPYLGAGQLQDDDTATPVLNISAYGSYTVELTVCDPLACDTDTVTVSTHDNLPPVAYAGNDQTADLYDTVCLTGSGTDPNNDEIAGYEWMVYDPQGDLIANESTAQICIYVDQAGTYAAHLLVFDGELWSEQADTALITVENSKPIAVIVPAGNQTVTIGTEVCLDGNSSYDPDGDDITYSWTITHLPGTSSAYLGDTEAPIACFTPDQIGDYIVQLIVTDEYGLESVPPESVTITAEEEQFIQVPAAETCADIEEAGLVCEEIEDCNDEVPAGAVISQVPGPGDMVLPGSTTVTLTVSSGPCSAIPCDLDSDGDVDADDRNIFLSCYRLCTGDAGYLPEADYDNDGCISLNDYREWYRCYNENL